MEDEKLLPKPQIDLPLPEKEIPARATPQGQALQNQKPNIFKSKFFLGFVAFSILIAFLIGGFYLGRNSVLKELNPTAPVIPPKDPAIYEASPTPDLTADWETYSGDYYSFKYPKSWIPYAYGEKQGTYSIPSDGQGEYFLSPLNDSDLGIRFEVSPTKDTSKEVMEEAIKNYSWTNKVISNIKIDGINAIKVTGNSDGSENAVVVFGNSIYVYRIVSNGRKINNFDQILSTFKFTN